jgi:transcriptional regulator with PAS, ATPase and Fis domain
LRADFLFRCEDRIIWIAPLQDRPADVPGIARVVWNDLQDKRIERLLLAEKRAAQAERREPRDMWVDRHLLVPDDARDLVDRQVRGEIVWDGNVRALRTLLGLAISPFSANRCSSSTILGSPTLLPLQLDSRNRKKRV